MNERDDGWDLSGLLETMEPPAEGFTQLRRRWRRRRWAARTATVAVVGGVVAAVVGFVVPGTGGSRQVVVAGPPTSLQRHFSETTTQPGPSSVATTPAAGGSAGSAGQAEPSPPAIRPAPASAAAGSKPFDVDGLRFWLPPSWYDSQGSVCAGEDGYRFMLSPEPCSQTTDRLTVNLGPAYPGMQEPGTQTTVVNGLSILTTPGSAEEYVPSLLTTFTATGAAAQAVATTLQPSPAAEVIETSSGALPSTSPAGWRHVVFDGLKFAVPPSWPVHDPSNAICGEMTVGAVDLGQSPIVATCPPMLGAPTTGPSDGVAVQDSSHAGSGTPALDQATTAGGAALDLSADSLGQPMVEADVTAAGKSFIVLLYVGEDPSIAWNILGSIAPTSSTTNTPSRGS